MENNDIKEKVNKALKEVMHPEIELSLIDLGIIKDFSVNSSTVHVTMAFPFPGIPIRDYLIGVVQEPIERLGLKAEIEETYMDEAQLKKFFHMEQQYWKE